MSKELEALEIIGKLYLINDEQVKDWDRRDFNILKSALKRLEAIDNANPSKALKTLKDMLIGNGVNDNINDYVDNLILPIKQALLQADMDKKELEEYKKIFKALFKEIVFEEKGHTTHKNWVRNNEYADWYAIKLTNEYGFQINNIHLTKDERDVFIKKMKEVLE